MQYHQPYMCQLQTIDLLHQKPSNLLWYYKHQQHMHYLQKLVDQLYRMDQTMQILPYFPSGHKYENPVQRREELTTFR